MDNSDLFELFPPPRRTGTVHVWVVDERTDAMVRAIFDAMEFAMAHRDTEMYGQLVASLTSLPGHPKMAEGDHVDIQLREPLVVSYAHKGATHLSVAHRKDT